MKKVHEKIVEAIFYYASLEKYDELYAIISLLERHSIDQPIVEQLKGDLDYLFSNSIQACDSYKQAAAIYEKNGEIKKSQSLAQTIVYIEKTISNRNGL